MGPLCCGEGRTIRPEGWAQGIAPTCCRARDGASASPAGPHGFFVHGGTKTQHWGGLSLGDFSLAKQREVTRAPWRRAEKDRDVDATAESNVKMDSGFCAVRSRNDDESYWIPAFAGMTTIVGSWPRRMTKVGRRECEPSPGAAATLSRTEREEPSPAPSARPLPLEGVGKLREHPVAVLVLLA